MADLTRAEMNEEIEHFRDYCGWSERRIEEHLGLAEGTLLRRRNRAAHKVRESTQQAA